MIDRRMLMNIDWMLLLMVGGIAWGLVTVYSATHGRLETHLDDFYLKQIYWFGAGLADGVRDLSGLPTAEPSRLSPAGSGNSLARCGISIRRVASGARRWLVFGPLSFQPSELVKVFLVLSFARYFTETRRKVVCGSAICSSRWGWLWCPSPLSPSSPISGPPSCCSLWRALSSSPQAFR